MLVNLVPEGALMENNSTTVFKEEDVHAGEGKPLQEVEDVSLWVFICHAAWLG